MPLVDFYLRLASFSIPLARYHSASEIGDTLWVKLKNPKAVIPIRGRDAIGAFWAEHQMVVDAWDAEQRVTEGWVNVWGDDD